MNKDEIINQVIPDDREPENVTVSIGNETFEWSPENPEVDQLVITGGGGLFVVVEDPEDEDVVYRYGPTSVEEIVYQNTGYEDLEQTAEDVDMTDEPEDPNARGHTAGDVDGQ